MDDSNKVSSALRPKLNGWQRLWIVLAILWAIPVLFFTITAVDTEAKIKARWARDLVSLEKQYHSSFTWFVGKSDEEIIHPARSNEPFDPATAEPVTDDELAARAVINNDYPRQISELPHARTKTLQSGFLVWAIPLSALYLFGLACRWVRRGFWQPPGVPS